MANKGKGVPKPKPAKPDEGEKALKTPLNICKRPLRLDPMERVKGVGYKPRRRSGRDFSW